jgi:hypothetical protein
MVQSVLRRLSGAVHEYNLFFCISMFSMLFGVCVVWNYFALVVVNASVTLKEVH